MMSAQLASQLASAELTYDEVGGTPGALTCAAAA